MGWDFAIERDQLKYILKELLFAIPYVIIFPEWLLSGRDRLRGREGHL